MPIRFVSTCFENASPLDWDVAADGILNLRLIYDRERNSPNRAALHWHVQLQGDPGETHTFRLGEFNNIWNGRPGSPIRDATGSVISEDGEDWTFLQGRKTEDNRLEHTITLPASGRLFVARIEPYRISIWELNAHWAKGLGRAPLGRDWVALGEQACEAFAHYFDNRPG